MSTKPEVASIAFREPLLRGDKRPRVALVGHPRTGKSALFHAASSASPKHERLLREGQVYDECLVEIGFDQISLVDLPSVA